MSAQDRRTLGAMFRFGGGFASALAAAAEHAAPENLAKLKAAFPAMWSHYEMMAGLIERPIEAVEAST